VYVGYRPSTASLIVLLFRRCLSFHLLLIPTKTYDTMQRIIRRAALAKQRAHRKNREALSKRKYDEVHAYVREIAQVRKAQTDHLKNARKNQREDWKLGPLAPRRDVGDNKEAYGTVEASIIQNPIVPRHRRMPRPCIYEGDRVVILEGPDEGKIGLVRNVDKMEETVTVLEKNLVCVIRQSISSHDLPMLTTTVRRACASLATKS